MLVSREVDAVDAVGIVREAFALEDPFLPFAYLQILVRGDIDAEPVAEALLPVSVVEAAVIAVEAAVTVGAAFPCLAVVASAVHTDARRPRKRRSGRMLPVVPLQLVGRLTGTQGRGDTEGCHAVFGLQEHGIPLT